MPEKINTESARKYMADNGAYRLLTNRVRGSYVEPEWDPTSIEGVNLQAHQLYYHGGLTQHDRMIQDKKKSLQKATLYSYQRAFVRRYVSDVELETESVPAVRALINPNQVKQNYDDKVISVEHEHGFAPGDIFEWVDTGTYWLIYLQDLTELAYFRGDARKCSHEIAWKDENDVVHKTYAAIRGPVETSINVVSKGGISGDIPNYSLNILLPKNEATLNYFKRYSKFYLSGDDKTYNLCWRVEAVNWLSMPGVIEINASEYYRNEMEDDTEHGIVGSLITKPLNPNPTAVEETILGEAFIKPKKAYEYEYQGNLEGVWSVGKNIPVSLKQNGKKVELRWIATYSGQFDLYYGGAYKKTISVQSLF